MSFFLRKKVKSNNNKNLCTVLNKYLQKKSKNHDKNNPQKMLHTL